MDKIPHITQEHLVAAAKTLPPYARFADLTNKAIEIALAEANAEQEPTCQVRNLDTGKLKTMTREAAKKLQAELGATVLWETPVYGAWHRGADLFFEQSGIYTYKLIPKPLKQVSWNDLPAHVAVTHKGVVGFYVGSFIDRNGESSREVLFLDNQGYGKDIHAFDDKEVLKLAPASEQKWIAVQDGVDGYELVNNLRKNGLGVEIYLHGEKYRITGLVKGYELK